MRARGRLRRYAQYKEEKRKGRHRRVSLLVWTAELFFVLSVPPLFLFYLMGWRPFTGKKEDES